MGFLACLSQELHLVYLERLQHLGQPLVLLRPQIPVLLEEHLKHPLLLEPPLAAALAPKPTSTSHRPSQKAIRPTNLAGDDLRLPSSTYLIVVSGCSVPRCTYQGAMYTTFNIKGTLVVYCGITCLVVMM